MSVPSTATTSRSMLGIRRRPIASPWRACFANRPARISTFLRIPSTCSTSRRSALAGNSLLELGELVLGLALLDRAVDG